MKTDKIYKTPAVEITGMESESAFLSNSGTGEPAESGFSVEAFDRAKEW